MKTLTMKAPARPAEKRLQTASAILSLILGLFYLLSGIGKILNVNAFVGVLQSYGVPSPLFYGAAIIPPVEVLLGLGFCLFVYNRRLAAVSVVLLLAFTAGFAYAYFVRGVQDCGCFGDIDALKTSPLVSFLRNFLLLGASVYLWMRPVRRDEGALRTWKAVTLAVVGAAAFTVAGMSTFRPLSSSGESIADRYLHQPVGQTPLADVVRTSADSTYLVLAYSTTCPHCWNAIENAKAFQRTGTVDRVVGLTVSSDSALAAFNAMFEPNFETRVLQPDQFRPLTNLVPTAFFIQGDRVVHVATEVESPFLFRQRDFSAAAQP